MNDYWNDPPEVDEIPECCDEVMTVDEQGNCLCGVCGKTIPRPPDIYPVDDVPFEWKETELTGIKFWTAEPQTHVVYRIFQKNETAFQCYLTTGSSYQFCRPITEDLDSFEAAEEACKSNYYEPKISPPAPVGQAGGAKEKPLPEPGGD